MPSSPTLLWFRRNLRLGDNPALGAALALRVPIIPVFLWAPEEEAPWAPGAASRWWLHHSLKSLDADLRRRGSRLIIRRGPSLRALRALVAETGADTVIWNRLHGPGLVARDAAVRAGLRADGVIVHSQSGSLLCAPWKIRTKSEKPFQVFTPFWKACAPLIDPDAPGAAPGRIAPPRKWPESLTIDALDLLPRPDWASGLREAWQPGEAGAAARLRRFVGEALADYPRHRDRPDLAGTSRLSPHLHFGEIGPHQVWHAADGIHVRHAASPAAKAAQAFLRQIMWREFAHHLLYHFPDTPSEPLRPAFADFPWKRNAEHLRAWQRGETGYPIVDAGMRELWRTGWMHNRVRMIVASFLVKDLLIPWQEGAAWFWDTLVDADLANNTLGWQWCAGCGADAVPFFRIFNPVSQGEKFDPRGDYVRRWVPEIATLPDRFLHRPWEAPAEVLSQAGIALGESYPRPMVDHRAARARALEAFARIRK